MPARAPQDYAACKHSLVEQGRKMADVSLRSRKCIAEHGNPFIRDGAVCCMCACASLCVCVCVCTCACVRARACV